MGGWRLRFLTRRHHSPLLQIYGCGTATTTRMVAWFAMGYSRGGGGQKMMGATAAVGRDGAAAVGKGNRSNGVEDGGGDDVDEVGGGRGRGERKPQRQC